MEPVPSLEELEKRIDRWLNGLYALTYYYAIVLVTVMVVMFLD